MTVRECVEKAARDRNGRNGPYLMVRHRRRQIPVPMRRYASWRTAVGTDAGPRSEMDRGQIRAQRIP